MKNKFINLINNYKGEYLVILSLLLWGLFPIITKFTYSYIDYKLSLAFSTLFSFFFFLIINIKKKNFIYFKEKKGWLDLLLSVVINGVIFYLILFYGLKFTSSINGSIFGLSEIFFSFFLFGFLIGPDKAKIHEIIGGILMIIGVLIVLFPGTFKVNIGDIFIIIASFFAPIGNYYAKKTVKLFPINFLMLIRSFIASIFLFLYIFLTSTIAINYDNFLYILPYLIFNGIVIFGVSKILWISAYKYLSVHRVSIFLCLYPIFTIIYNIILFLEFPNLFQVLGLIPIIIGIFFIFNKKNKGKIEL